MSCKFNGVEPERNGDEMERKGVICWVIVCEARICGSLFDAKDWVVDPVARHIGECIIWC